MTALKQVIAMPSRKLAIYIAVGAIFADLMAVAFFAWLHHQYAVGVDPSVGWGALAIVAIIGAAIGGAVFLIRGA
jgi:hypothetical protein